MRNKIAIVAAGMVLWGASIVNAQVWFHDDFSSGLNPSWWKVKQIEVFSEVPSAGYTLDATQGNLRINHPAGGGYIYRAIRIYFLPQVIGDFAMTVVFHNAQIALVDKLGQAANQIALHAKLGGTDFATTRDIAVVEGNNFHVYTNPPGQTYGVTPTTALEGTMAIRRMGTVTAGYFNGDLVYQNTFGTLNPEGLWFSLENNMTADTTAVTFDDFDLQADNIVGIPEPGAIGVAMLSVALLVSRPRRKSGHAGGT